MCDVFVVDPSFLDVGDGEGQNILAKNENALTNVLVNAFFIKSGEMI